MFSIFFFRNWITRSTTFRTVTNGIISGKWVSSAIHALAALLLAPKLLRPGNSQAATVRDSPQSTFPTSPLTVWYRESVRFNGPTTVGQSDKTKGLPVAAWSTGICIFDLMYAMHMPILTMQGDKDARNYTMCCAGSYLSS